MTVDFGRPYVGFLGIDVEGEEAPGCDVAWHEVPWADGSIRPCLNLPLRQMFSYTLRGGRQRFSILAANTARFVRVVNRGGRPVTLHAVSMVTYVAPRPTATFLSSDQTLNRVFDAACITANNCVIDLCMDNPERERNGWFHDGYWSCFTYTLLSADASVLRRMCRMGSVDFTPAGKAEVVSEFVPHEGGEVIPGHSLFWLLQAKLDSDLSGENDYAPQVAEGIHRFLKNMATFENREGLLEKVPGLELARLVEHSHGRRRGLAQRPAFLGPGCRGRHDRQSGVSQQGKDHSRNALPALPGNDLPRLPASPGRRSSCHRPSRRKGRSICPLVRRARRKARSKALWQAFATAAAWPAPNTYTLYQRLHYAALHGDIRPWSATFARSTGNRSIVARHPFGAAWRRTQLLPGSRHPGSPLSLVQGVLGIHPSRAAAM